MSCNEADICEFGQTCFWETEGTPSCVDCQYSGSPPPINTCAEYTPYGQSVCEFGGGKGVCYPATNNCRWCSGLNSCQRTTDPCPM